MRKEEYCEWCRTGVAGIGCGWFGQFANVGGELVHYVSAGEGEPLLLVHGFTAWSYTWRHNLSEFAKFARVYAPDLRGYGLTEKSKDRGHSLDDQVELLKAFMDELGLEQAVLCGHSMGGEICLRLALRYPERVKALILVSASSYVRASLGRIEHWLLRVPGLSKLILRATVLNRRFVDRTMRYVYRTADRITPPDVEAYLFPARAPGAADAFARIIKDLDFGAYAHRVKEVLHHSLLIWGENDPVIPRAHGERLAQELPNSQLIILPECGHVPPEEQPEAFNQAVIEFLTAGHEPH